MTSQECSELLQWIDQATALYPCRIFNVTPGKDSTPVREIAFVLENMLDQLKKPLVPNTQSLAQALVYKFNGAHRRQGYWRNYKNLVRLLRKYNESDLLARVSDLHKKVTASGAGFYLPSVDVLRYIGCAYLKRLFRLQQIQDLCVRTAHVIMGQLELGHWERFSLFVVALCADINNGIRTHVTSMEPVYAGFSKLLKPFDNRFPDSFTDIPIYISLRGRASMKKTVDTARIMRLLKLSDEQLDAMHSKDQMLRFRDEMLTSMKRAEESVDLGVAVDREMDDNMDENVPGTEVQSGMEFYHETSSSEVYADDAKNEQVDDMVKKSGRSQKLLLKPKKSRKGRKDHQLSVSSALLASNGNTSRIENAMEGITRSQCKTSDSVVRFGSKNSSSKVFVNDTENEEIDEMLDKGKRRQERLVKQKKRRKNEEKHHKLNFSSVPNASKKNLNEVLTRNESSNKRLVIPKKRRKKEQKDLSISSIPSSSKENTSRNTDVMEGSRESQSRVNEMVKKNEQSQLRLIKKKKRTKKEHLRVSCVPSALNENMCISENVMKGNGMSQSKVRGKDLATFSSYPAMVSSCSDRLCQVTTEKKKRKRKGLKNSKDVFRGMVHNISSSKSVSRQTKEDRTK